jgi:hypothetical protein
MFRKWCTDPQGWVAVPPFLKPRPPSYREYEGPWLEESFEQYFQAQGPLGLSRTYLPLRWTSYGYRFGYVPHQELQDYLDLALQPGESYFTVIQSAHGILEKLPEDVLVFAAGGVGDIPLPLLKGDREYRFDPVKRFKVYFQGDFSTTRLRQVDVRARMHELLAEYEDFHFLPNSSLSEFEDVLAASEFVLCPRGFGRTSFRLYEAMSFGAIPIYIWEEVEWLPYPEEIDWNELIVSVHTDQISELPGIIAEMGPEEISAKQKAIQAHHDDYFTYPAICRYIVETLSRH